MTGNWSTMGMLNICLGIGVLLASIFLPFPEIDLHAAALFYKGGNDFWLRFTAFNAWSNDFLRPAIGWVAGFLLIYFLFRWATIPLARIKELTRLGFFLLCIVLATGFVVHAVFKDNWGRARPKHVEIFGGTKEFTPPLLIADQCDRNCSFVSGDASLGYVTLALALMAARRRKLWIAVSLGAGLGLGLLRMMNGSHFLSDILFSGVITCGSVLLLYRWVIERKLETDFAFLQPTWNALSSGIGALIPSAKTEASKHRRAALRSRLTGLFR
ncbi:phosphatase PAP2 family protein [Rhodospirillaceae bacterium KN72]|uniref:Phosphatase PAP2 family protein n=1 Tax=Pacificispira spongiicola TaxID=2729598 RepID=A0A7Y0E1I8_9PROT|nr:phosphatase PAP2 family protein [Pacificispira spongiicola]NMM45527.1 phosphatase PAP2 family protein [Pacificispira spongiicola]